MTTRTVYVPRLIESAEQAEALPDGTLALKPDGEPAEAIRDRLGRCWHDMGGTTSDDDETIGWTALVPIEAEEETVAFGDEHAIPTHNGVMPNGDPIPNDWRHRTRLVTPWEEHQ